MKINRRSSSIPFSAFLLIACIHFCQGNLPVAAQESRGDQARKEEASRESKRESHRGNPVGKRGWNNLSEEQQARLREAFRRAWADPEVLSAREEVKNAAKNYSNAVKRAVLKNDPSVAELLDKVQAENEGKVKQLLTNRMQHSGAGPGEKHPGGHFQIGPPGFLEKLSKEDRQKVLKAQAIARDLPEVKAVLMELEEIRAKEEDFRKERTKIFMKLRRTSRHALLSVDPDLEKILPSAGPPFPPKGRRQAGGDQKDKK